MGKPEYSERDLTAGKACIQGILDAHPSVPRPFWDAAVARAIATARDEGRAEQREHRFGSPPEPVVNPNQAWCDRYAAWYYQEPE